MAVVGLEKTFYNITEDADVVEVCAIVYSPTIDCPIAFPFNVSLSTEGFSAGIEFLSELQSFSLPVWYVMHGHNYHWGSCPTAIRHQ